MSGPLFTPEDERRWLRLVEAANAAVERPADRVKAADFKQRADLCWHKGVMPVPEADKVACRPFAALTGFGRFWSALSSLARRENVEAVLTAIEGVEAQLGSAATDRFHPTRPDALPRRLDTTSDPPRRVRLDIDG
jgi:hypothetical protein